MQKQLNKLGNPLVKWVLCSPFHAILSSHLIVISFKGRTTGKPYSIPVEYKRADGTILLSTSQDRRWWRNLCTGDVIKVRLQGKDLYGNVETFTDKPTVTTIVGMIYPRMKADQLEKFAQNRVAMRITL